MKKLLISILCLSSFSVYASNISAQNKPNIAMQRQNDLNNPENMRRICAQAFSDNNLDKIEDLILKFKKPQAISYQGKNYTYDVYDLNINGDYKIEPCYAGIISSFNSPAINAQEATKYQQILLNYLKLHSKSELAITLNAIYEKIIALKIRNNDFSFPLANLSKQELNNYNIHINNAINFLSSSQELFHIPLWYQTRIELENLKENKDQSQVDKYLNQSIKLYPDYLPSYLAYTKTLLPENGGSWMLVNNVAQKSMLENQDKYSNEFYARFYAGLAKSYKFNGLVYNQSLFEVAANQFLIQFNTDYNYNRMAKAACTLNSPRLFITYASKMTTINPDVWENTEFYNQCMAGMKLINNNTTAKKDN